MCSHAGHSFAAFFLRISTDATAMAPRRSSPLRSNSFARMDPTLVERMLATVSGSHSRSQSTNRVSRPRRNSRAASSTARVEPRTFEPAEVSSWSNDGVVAPRGAWSVSHRSTDAVNANHSELSSGFLLQRARAQRMTSLSSKRSRSSSVSSSVASRPLSGPQAKVVPAAKVPRKEVATHATRLPTQIDGSHMFKGMTAVPLSAAVVNAIGSSQSAAPKAAGGEKLPFGRDPRERSSACRVQPLWCMVGTFKTSLENVVQVSQGVMQWHQRNPNGGYQRLAMPLSLMTSVSCATVVVSKSETTTSVVIKTAGKPSQITFGFVRSCDASAFRLRLLALMDQPKK